MVADDEVLAEQLSLQYGSMSRVCCTQSLNFAVEAEKQLCEAYLNKQLCPHLGVTEDRVSHHLYDNGPLCLYSPVCIFLTNFFSSVLGGDQ